MLPSDARRQFSQLTSAFLAIAVIALILPDAWACSCVETTPEDEFKASSSVFSGKVITVQKNSRLSLIKRYIPFLNRTPEDRAEFATFEVSQVWKGPEVSRLVVRNTAFFSGCGNRFEVGQEYLLYAYAKDSNLVIGPCFRVRSLARAVEDLNFLGKGSAPPRQERTSSLTAIVWSVIILMVLVSISILIARVRRMSVEKPR